MFFRKKVRYHQNYLLSMYLVNNSYSISHLIATNIENLFTNLLHHN